LEEPAIAAEPRWHAMERLTMAKTPTADEQRRLLELLSESADGCTDALLQEHGFKLDVLISLVSAEFATAKPERTFAGSQPVEVTRVRITEAGRRALAERQE
jgi:hypothetical protein